MSNDNNTFSDFWPNKHRQFADRAIQRTVEGLKDQCVPYETIVHSLFDCAIAEATGSPEHVAEESLTFRRTLALFQNRLNALVNEWDKAFDTDQKETHLESSAD